MMTHVTEVHAETEAALESGDNERAFTVLRPVLERSDELDSHDWSASFVLFARIATGLAADELAGMAGLARRVAGDPTDDEALYDLGYDLIEQRLHRVAVPVLERANRLRPGDEGILNELVVALEGARDHARIRTVLRENPALLRKRFRFRYALASNTIMDGDLADARRLARTLRPGFRANNRTMAGRITTMLARADAVSDVCALDGDDLRGWHFVLTGGLLLHRSPHGFEDMRGRYAYTTDSEDRCLEAIRRLSAVLDALDERPEQVLALPDRNSRALAIAVAHELERPVTALDPAAPDAPGLLVAYDLESIAPEVLDDVALHRRGQMLWVHAAQWTVDQPVTADLTTYLHQVNVGPWDAGRMRVDPESKEVTRSAEVEGTPEQLAERVLRAELQPDALDDLDALVALARAVAASRGPGIVAALQSDGQREPYWAGGPVHSNWFH